MQTNRGTHFAEALIPTERAARYLAQLSDHLKSVAPAQRQASHEHRPHSGPLNGDGPPPLIATDVRRSTTLATIRFDLGTCTLIAEDHALRMRLSAADPQTLERMKASFGQRLEQIGRHDNLTIKWTAAAK